MKFNPTFLEVFVFFLVCLLVFIWMKYGRKIHRWLQDCFRRRRGPRNLKPKSPEDCPLCNRHICALSHRSKPEVVPWSERKSRRGRPKIVDTRGHACLNLLCDYFAIADPEIYALVSNSRRGKQRILYLKCQACGDCRTSRYGTPLYHLKTPLTQIAMVMTAMSEGVDISAASRTWSIAYDKKHLQLHIHWGLAYYHFCRPHQSLTLPIRGPSKRRYRTPVMAARLVRHRWLVRDLLQLPVPEGVWLDTFPATKGCR